MKPIFCLFILIKNDKNLINLNKDYLIFLFKNDQILEDIMIN